jgi:flagellar basal-body rod protein FlgB
MKIISEPFGIHEKVLQARSQRLELLAGNIANADTPKFKAQDIDFKQVLGSVQRDTLQTTHTAHFALSDAGVNTKGVKYRIPFNASADGNTVELSVEQAQYGKAAADYRATLSFIENRASSIKRALRGE